MIVVSKLCNITARVIILLWGGTFQSSGGTETFPPRTRHPRSLQGGLCLSVCVGLCRSVPSGRFSSAGVGVFYRRWRQLIMSDTWSNIQAHKKQLDSLRERLQRRRKDPAQLSAGTSRAGGVKYNQCYSYEVIQSDLKALYWRIININGQSFTSLESCILLCPIG